MRTFLMLTIMLSTFAASGCQRQDDSQNPRERTSAAKSATVSEQAGHAPAGARPGSHEDWCDEHQVPESLCTRCNPTLAAAFKASGDWCPEHDRPESQCLICNPHLKIQRPPPAGAASP